jgi:hypothetical protein
MAVRLSGRLPMNLQHSCPTVVAGFATILAVFVVRFATVLPPHPLLESITLEEGPLLRQTAPAGSVVSDAPANRPFGPDS